MITIIWDIDDTLNDFQYRWFINYKFNNNLCCIDNYEKLKENPCWGLLGISTDRYHNSIDRYRRDNYTLIQPNKEILEWFECYGYKAEHIALTAAPLEHTDITAYWLFKHFGQWIRTFHFIPSERRSSYYPIYDKNKVEYIINKFNKKKILFVDDNEINISEAEKLGITSYCVKQPWNKGEDIEFILEKLTKKINEDKSTPII